MATDAQVGCSTAAYPCPAHKRPRLVLLISCGWAVRDYIRSEFLSLISKEADVVVVLTPGDRELECQLRQNGIRVETLVQYQLPKRLTALNGLLAAAHNRRLGFWNPHLWKWMVSLNSPFKRPYYEFQRGLAKLLSRSPLYELLVITENRLLASLRLGRLYEDLFDEIQPSAVFSTNPYNLQELLITLLAKARGIRTIGAISSWDNLSYKGPLPVEHDHHVVWSESMRQELLIHKPHLDSDRITITGTPQFDFHLREDLIWSREEFFARLGGDPNRKLITYGGSVDNLFPDETEFVARLWKAVEAGEIVDRPQLLVRLHPHDNTERLASLKSRCPGLLISRPWPYDAQRFWWFTPELGHLALLSNTILYSEVGLNVSSSLTLDFAVLGKPVVNIAFPGIEGNPKSCYVRDCYKSYHYRRVIESGGVRLAKSLDELLYHVNLYLQNPTLDHEARVELVHAICGPVDGCACHRIAERILSVLQSVTRAEANVPSHS